MDGYLVSPAAAARPATCAALATKLPSDLWRTVVPICSIVAASSVDKDVSSSGLTKLLICRTVLRLLRDSIYALQVQCGLFGSIVQILKITL